MRSSVAQSLGRAVRRVGVWLAFRRPDFVVLAGLGSLTFGAWLIYEPAAYIVLGVGLVVLGVADALSERTP